VGLRFSVKVKMSPTFGFKLLDTLVNMNRSLGADGAALAVESTNAIRAIATTIMLKTNTIRFIVIYLLI
jgi:hypothetical protein